MLHAQRVVARAQSVDQIKLMRLVYRVHVKVHTETGLLWQCNLAIHNFQRIFGQALAVLPNPVGVYGRDPARCGGCDLREHGQRYIKVVV